MYLKKLNILNFKSIVSADSIFSEGINCFVGDNGAGKTNILEAIHYISLSKSFVGTTDRQNITHNEEFFMLEGEYLHHNGVENRYNCSYSKKNGKSIKKNDKSYQKISEHIGAIPVVTITPKDNMLIEESGEARRKYIDTYISQYNPEYLNALIKYNGVITQRNQLLREGDRKEINDMIDIYNYQAIPYAEKIYQTRRNVIKELLPVVSNYYSIISDGVEDVDIEYSSQLHTSSLLELFEERVDKDIALGYTTVGIGKDDIKLNLKGHPIKRFGSQGQQKSLLIALKLAQYDILSQKRGFKPLLLLDDLFDRLDASRVERLIDIVQEKNFGQIFITDCDKERVENLLQVVDNDCSIFEIYNGEISHG